MGTTTPLRRFLQSLCNNSCWNYAVFWRLQQQNQMVLMWEDGYFSTMKVQDSMEDLFTDTKFGGLEETLSNNTQNGTLNGDAVELAVAYMSTFQYALGDGVVGDVAYTGNSHWIFSGEYNPPYVPEHADEWLFQFAAGVKTILLVPVNPHGVLQLGSLQHIPEDAEMSNYIKSEFFTHQEFISYSDTFATNQQFPSSSSSSSPLFMMQSFDEFPSFTRSDEVNWSNHNGLITSDMGPSLSFPKECELHKALGPAFMANDSFRNLSIGHDNINGNVESSLGQFGSLTKRKNINENGESSVSVRNDHLAPNMSKSQSQSQSHNNDSCSPSAISYEGVGDVVEEGSAGAKPSIVTKKRGKAGGKQKARPRDRQLIQDRLKDLRELVPDGAKCSIDNLLDRTVKHMQFLKSVGDRATKLRQCVQPEGVGPTTIQTNEEKGSNNGASWAFELGSDLKVCPIIVEDLQYPGHMVIEMICDESSRFLEIAEVIHGLDLTILKGVTERRLDNTWARYIVEAPRGFHRLDIFWPLMKLLQQQQQHSQISSKI